MMDIYAVESSCLKKKPTSLWLLEISIEHLAEIYVNCMSCNVFLIRQLFGYMVSFFSIKFILMIDHEMED